MKTEIIKIDKENINKRLLNKAVKTIRAGSVVAFPTETVYGLGVNGLDESAVRKIYKAKGRPSDNPLILHISDRQQLIPLVSNLPKIASKLIDRFWPGPLTIVLKKSEIVPDIITGGLDTVAIRMPKHPIALELISQSGFPIAAPSANISGKPSPTKAEHVIQDMKGKIPLIIDGGRTGVGLESTVLDLSTRIPRILRPGGITLEDLQKVIPNLVQDEALINMDLKPKSPGQKYRHYAPKAEMIVYNGEIERVIERINLEVEKNLNKGKKIGIMATEETRDKYKADLILSVGSRKNVETIAANLFATIRELDGEGVDLILAEGIKDDNLGNAIMNRMVKAANRKIIQV